MKILVTGASGFLGGALASSLSRDGHDVTVLVRPGGLKRLPVGVSFRTVVGGLEDPTALKESLKDIAIVFHCAGLSTDWASNSEFQSTNVDGVKAILRAAARSPTLSRFVHVSTTDVYGYPRQPVDESFPLTDVKLPYNRTKILGEQLVWKSMDCGMPVTVVRPASIYGPKSKNFVMEFIALLKKGQMLTIDGGTAPAGLLYIDNCIKAMERLAVSPDAIGLAFNIRDPEDVSWRRYVDALADGAGTSRATLNLPGRFAFSVGAAMECAYGALRVSRRPLLTRHAVRILQRPQNYSINRLLRVIDTSDFVKFSDGVSRTIGWAQEVSLAQFV